MSRIRVSGFPLTVFGRVFCILAGAAFAGVLATAASIRPDARGYGTHEQLGLPPCGFHLVFDLPCPTCGATTSFAHFVRGEWRNAARANTGAFVLALMTTIALPWLAVSVVAGRLWLVENPLNVLLGLVVGLTAVALLQWMTRVIPSLVSFH